MRKKWMAAALCLAMAAAITGCGTGTQKEESKEAKNGADINGDGKVVVGCLAKNLVDPFQVVLNSAVEEGVEALMEEGIVDEWTGILDAESDAGKQVDRASECISKQCDIVIMLPAETTASDPALISMADAGIKVLMLNAKTDSTDEVAASYSGSDDVEAGEKLAQYVIEQVPEGGKYAHCLGVVGNSAQIARGEGIENVMGEHPEFECIGEFPCEWAADKAANVATDMLNKYGKELKAIICDNDDMSSAAQQVCNNAGRDDIICIGVDGSQTAMAMIKEGSLKGTILQDGKAQVEQSVDVIRKMAEGEEYDKEILVPFVTITKENVDDYYEEK